MYNYIYYKLYKMAKRTEKQWPQSMRMPATIAMFSISILQLVNFAMIFVLLVYGIKVLPPSTLVPEQAIFTMVLIYIVNYFLFVRNKKFLQIEERFDKDSKATKRIKSLLVWLYIILTFVLFFVVLETFKTVQR